jgi:hypothetical protein
VLATALIRCVPFSFYLSVFIFSDTSRLEKFTKVQYSDVRALSNVVLSHDRKLCIYLEKTWVRNVTSRAMLPDTTVQTICVGFNENRMLN